MSLALAGMLALAACGDDGADDISDGDIDADEVEDAEAVEAEVSRGEHVSSPRVTGPVAGGARGLPFPPMPTRLADEFGYIEEEFFIVGEATAYEPEGTWDEDGEWAARPTYTAPYETRILVRRPEAEVFNGTVVVEWLNVTTGLDLDNEFRFAHEELLREGYVWVGASAQQVGIEGGDGLFPGYPGLEEILALKEWDPERYGELDHPGDDYSYDIFSQVAQAIRRPDGVDPLDGLAARQVIATGQSQSAVWLVTYVNAVHSIADIYDGFMIHSRVGSLGVAPGPRCSRRESRCRPDSYRPVGPGDAVPDRDGRVPVRRLPPGAPTRYRACPDLGGGRNRAPRPNLGRPWDRVGS